MSADAGLLPPDGPVWPTATRAFPVPMTVAVISDTHVYRRGGRRVARPVFDLLRRFRPGLVVHLGDVNVGEVLDDLAEIAPLLAVTGNNDDDELLDLLPRELFFDIGPHRFLAVHGHNHDRLSARKYAESRDGEADVILFGHSHEPLIERGRSSILFNPGSATDRRWYDHFGVGLIHVTADRIEPELVLFADPAHLVNIEPDH